MHKALIVAAAIAAIITAAPAAAHIPERCHDRAAELIATEGGFIKALDDLGEMILDRMPMFMVEQAMANFTGELVAKTFAEERLTKCIVGVE